jgi:predicted O-methyltransferase YrrM
MKHFDWKQYIANYPDLVSAGINNQRSALIHYNRYGRSEGRVDFTKSSLTNYFSKINFKNIEGYCYLFPRKYEIFLDLLNNNNIKNILEIGFNGGHSSEFFLNNSNANILSFDLGIHDYLSYGKRYIDNVFPNRHTLILGDSILTIPKYQTDIKFDIIFIDGGHEYSVAKADLENCKRFAHSESIVIMDDTMYTPEWVHDYTKGPTLSWTKGIENNLIVEIGREDICNGGGISWGKYNI